MLIYENKKKIIINIFKGLFTGVFIGIGLLTTLIGYSAWTNLQTQNPGDKITSTIWNNIINQLNTLGNTVDNLNTQVSSLSSLPSGAVISFNLSSCPTGWSEADGTNGNPDLRGEFIRGLDNGRGVDSGRSLGSLQNGSLVMNVYGTSDNRVFNLVENGDGRLGYDNPLTKSDVTYSWMNNSSAGIGTWSGLGYVDNRFVGMTRPRNIALLYCVKD